MRKGLWLLAAGALLGACAPRITAEPLPGVRVNVPMSQQKLDQIAKTSWSLEQAQIPESPVPGGTPITLDDAVAQAKLATRQYAKRQRTWFRRQHQPIWIGGSDPDQQCAQCLQELARVLG